MGASLNNLPISFNGGQVALAINALKSLNLARSLAEPNLTTLNGHPASFRAGGEFPVPVVTGATATGLQGVQFVPFGVSLQFTPIITDGNRIRLTLNSTVSNRDAATAQTSINGAGVSSLNTRNFSSTVELREGQTLAVAGLIQNNLGSDATRVPFLGDIPVLGRLFAFDRTSSGDQELIVLVTPELVHPLDKNELPACLPGDHLVSPTDVEFYLHGRLLSRKPAPVYPATYPTGSIRGFMTGPLVGPAPAAPVTAVGGVKPASLATATPAAAPAAAPDPRKLREVERRLLFGSSGFAESR